MVLGTSQEIFFFGVAIFFYRSYLAIRFSEIPKFKLVRTRKKCELERGTIIQKTNLSVSKIPFLKVHDSNNFHWSQAKNSRSSCLCNKFQLVVLVYLYNFIHTVLSLQRPSRPLLLLKYKSSALDYTHFLYVMKLTIS